MHEIGHLGFSSHGDIECITRFLNAYGNHMEFGQLELNYFGYIIILWPRWWIVSCWYGILIPSWSRRIWIRRRARRRISG